MNVTRNLATLALTAASLGAASSGFATEGGAPTTAFGVYDFGAGFTPPPTPHGTVGLRTNYHWANTVRDSHGRDNGTDISLGVLSLGFAYLKMTQTEVFGARYGYGLVAPFFKMDVDLKVKAGGTTVFADDAHLFRQADLQVMPLILQWEPSRNLGVNFWLQVQAPTGDYDKNRLANPGLNHWAFSPILNFSYITDSGLEASSSFQADFSTRNPDTDYRNGVEYRHEFAVGQHIGPWTAGLGGYYYRQLSDDDAPGLTRGNRARTLALGPALNYFQPGLPPVWFHLYKEFDSRNRAQGYAVALRVSHSF
ncbi:SphA family protein [Pseudomonas sp. KNUC1026]|uniref:SphA family protein n=1 Tax=Pseudomonas sp. KNUC1026 TaxID=2893890 RepID=UPI001F45ADA8|nr:transporter [Pseudomonas sp. KNUC1026]UFH48312.1 transporter [Pseudomonas sp. KNUC1026]